MKPTHGPRSDRGLRSPARGHTSRLLRATAAALLLAAVVTPVLGQPAACTDARLARELGRELLRFEAELDAPRGPAPIVAAELLSANSHRGEALLAPTSLGASRLYLNRLQELGLQGVTLHIAYPVLLPQFPRAAEYLEFYRAVVQEVRRRGLQLHIKTGPSFQQPEFGSVVVHYEDLSVQDYLAGRVEQALRIERELRPDLLTFGNEPSTEEAVTGFALPPRLYLAFVRAVLSRLERGGVAVGVGAGTWEDSAYVEAFARETNVDFIDLHLYPLGNGRTSYLDRAVELMRLARRAGKRVVVGEAWLYKASMAELRAGQASPATSPAVFSRDVFEGWSPLDQAFVRTVLRLARSQQVESVSLFWSNYLFAYLKCDPGTAALQPGDRQRLANRAAAQAMLAGRLSETGQALRALLHRR